jgi:hypothetical protein
MQEASTGQESVVSLSSPLRSYEVKHVHCTLLSKTYRENYFKLTMVKQRQNGKILMGKQK